MASLGGLRAPSSRPLIPLTWRDWKPRRLARALSRDRREGEGGEEGLGLEGDQGEESGGKEGRGGTGEGSRDTAEEKQERRGIFQALAPGKLAKVFSRSKGEEEEQETTGGTELEREEEREQKGSDRGEVSSEERGKSKEGRDGHGRREKANLLKALQIDRLKKSISKGDRGDSGSETCSSMESLDEAGQERKGRWKVSGFPSLPKRFSKKERECEGAAEVKVEESESRSLEKPTGTEGKGKAMWVAEENDEKQDEGKTEAAETVKSESSAEKKGEKFTVSKFLKSSQLSAVFSRGRSGGEEEKSGESDGQRVVEAEEEGQKESAIATQSNWRSRKTRKARRVTRGRKSREGSERESNTEGGESAEINDTDEESKAIKS